MVLLKPTNMTSHKTYYFWHRICPHNIAKLPAKLLSPLLGTIKNSGSLLNKLNDIDMNNKYLASLDIKSLYTNIPVDRCIVCLHNHLQISNFTLPLPISKLIKICTSCTSHCYFQYNNIFYKQKFGLSMGSPLSRVLACIYLEFLESGPFKYIISNTAHYFRYRDNILLIYPKGLDLHSITDRLNNVEPFIRSHMNLNPTTLYLFWTSFLLGILTN